MKWFEGIHKVVRIFLKFHFSAYYPVFRSMFRNVVAALNEAQDITLFLGPLAKHFEVSVRILLNIFMHGLR